MIVISNSFATTNIGPLETLFKIDKIEIQGLKKVESEAVLERITSRKGLVLDNYGLRKDISKIYSLKYFDSVEAHHKVTAGKNILVFVVVEKPIVTSIVFEGNDEVDDDDLLVEMKTKEFSILDVNTIKSDIIALQKFYEEKGFFLSTITYDIKKINKENAEVTFRIKEFDKVLVKKITFLGNKAFPDKTLKGYMETKEETLFSFLSNAGNFKEFNFQTDVERIKYFYKTKGYLQINVGTPEITISEDRKWVFITVKLTEGPQFTINDITFQGEVLFPESELLEKIALKNNKTYSEESLRKDIELLTELYQDKGYAFANVLRHLNIVPGENKVNVEFSFEKGKIAYFGKITVKGNTKTRDKVVRRELLIKEGSKFSGSSLRRSKENVNRLGFFEPGSVVFNTITPRGSDNVLDVEIIVKERSTGQISLGAGFSTATGAFLQASIAQTNFRGLGQNINFSLSISDTNQSFNVGFTEPYLFDSKWTGGADIFRNKNDQSSSFSFKRVGFNLRVGYPIFDYTRLFLTYKFEDTTLERVTDPTIDPTTENGIASGFRTTIEYDRRNNRFEPTKGYLLRFSNEYIGVGGDKKWIKNEVDTRLYYRVWEDLIFRSRFFSEKLEKVDGRTIPRTERFTLGGARNLRGYSFEAIGPKNTVFDSVSNLNRTFNAGGDFSAFTTFELEHPLAREAGLKWVVFFDAGDARNIDNFKVFMDYGFGFRWFSPIGVLRFEFGYPINPEDGNTSSQFHFDIGQLF